MDEYSKIYQLYEWGVKLYIGGIPATPEMVRHFVTRKRRDYMPVFYYDTEGNLDIICYN